MALVGFESSVTVATGASATYSPFGGIQNFSIGDSRDLLDITAFSHANVRARLAALRDVSLSLGGDLEPADAGLLKVRAAYDAGDTVCFQVFTHASSAQSTATSGFAYVMSLESLEISGSVDGKVELSLSAMINASAGSAIFTL